jgi:hypothetical protein
MSFLVINENKQRIDYVPSRENEIVYLYKDDEHKFPSLSSLDNYSHTFFLTDDDLDQLILELNLAKTEDEVEIAWKEHKNEYIASIARSELECNNVYDKNHWRVIESKKRLIQMKQYFQIMERCELIGQSSAEVSEHVYAIISLAQKCKEHQNHTFIHTPFE